MFELIVLGASFTAAGIASRYGQRCLVIEPGMQAGNEFLGALRFLEKSADVHMALQQCHTLFGTEIISVAKTGAGYTCVTCGVDGYCTYEAKQIIDTRCSEEMCVSKTYNLLIHSKEVPKLSNVKWESTMDENRYLVCCPVSLSCGYPEARAKVMELLARFSNGQKVVLLASSFDYQIKAGYLEVRDGILYLPSKAYATPGLAFAAGQVFGGW